MLRKHFTMMSGEQDINLTGDYNIVYEASEYVEFSISRQNHKNFLKNNNIDPDSVKYKWITYEYYDDGTININRPNYVDFEFLGYSRHNNIYTWEFNGEIPMNICGIIGTIDDNISKFTACGLDYSYSDFVTGIIPYANKGTLKNVPCPIYFTSIILMTAPVTLQLKSNVLFEQDIIYFTGISPHFKDITIDKNIKYIKSQGSIIDALVYNEFNSISVHPDNIIYDSRDNCNAIVETATNTIIVGCENTTIPEGILSINDYAIQDYTFESLTIPSTLQMWNMRFVGSKEFNYNGTIEQWLNLRKTGLYLYANDINTGIYQPYPVTVHCTDGDYIEEEP